MHREGAELAFTYQGGRVRGRTESLAQEFGSTLVFPCDVSSDEQIAQLFADLGQYWDKFDGFVHSIAYAPREALAGDFLEGFDREAFRTAHEVSAYSFPAMTKAALPRLNAQAALLTLSYLGAVRTIPHYNVMGLAKASLEASVRYLAMNLGRQGIRVNGISAGPIRTLAAAGIGDFNKLLDFHEASAPLRRNVTIEEVGNVAAFLCSDLASGVTGEITYVDGGFNTTALGTTEPH
jgi:enoyl-[acyl-carrier protein] reductase I